MEYVLIPLIAIAVVAYSVFKMAELMFHVHLSFRLLLLLIVAAWMISILLPGLLFHTIGALGTVGICLVSAIGFAWIATVHEGRSLAAQPASTGSSPASPPESSDPPRTTLADSVLCEAERNVSNRDEAAVSRPGLSSGSAMETVDRDFARLLAAELQKPEPVPLAAIEVQLREQPVATATAAGGEAKSNEAQETDGICASDEELTEGIPIEEVALTEVSVPEDGTTGSEAAESEASEDEATGQNAAAYMETSQVEYREQPLSDSLEDLLDYAFLQRSRNRTDSALETFRLIKHLYAGSDALPMIAAEIVSTLQSRGDYAGAVAELEGLLLLPEIQRQDSLVRAFGQKLAELRAGNASGDN